MRNWIQLEIAHQGSNDANIGLEILHLFILDLLGRETVAARIFELKSEEDFEHSVVVTWQTQLIAWIAVVALNLFFAIYSILRGYQKGVAWQYSYLIGCITQLITEIFFFETIEAIWLNLLVPNLVATDIQRVNELLTETICDLCSTSRLTLMKKSRFLLNVPDYLFVSTIVAKSFPNLVESIIVLSYRNYLPGELATKWRIGPVDQYTRQQQWRNLSVVSVVFLTLQWIGTTPYILQKMIVRFIQPIFLSGIVLIWTTVASNPIYLSIFIFGIIMLLFLLIYRFIQENKLLPKTYDPSTVMNDVKANRFANQKETYNDFPIVESVQVSNLLKVGDEVIENDSCKLRSQGSVIIDLPSSKSD